MILIASLIATAFGLYFKIIPIADKKAAYESTFLAGVVIIVLYVVLTAVMTLVREVRQYYRVAGRIPIPTSDETRESELREVVKEWLGSKLSDAKLNVKRSVLYGSVVHDYYSTNDVDIIILFKSASDGSLRRAGLALRENISSLFRQRFGIPLHLKCFSAPEIDRFNAYMVQIGKCEDISLV